MSGYVKWFADRYEELLQARLSSICELRSALKTAQGHKRTPGNMAALAFGFRLFLDYGSDVGVITQEHYDDLWARALYAINNAAMNQSQHSEAYEPARRFIESIRSALTSGMARVTGQNGAYPPNPIMWGWQKLGPDWEPKGDCISWYDGGELLLEPGASYSIAQRHAQRCGEILPVSMKTLHKRLHQQGYLASIEESPKDAAREEDP